jgi:hypothetical protein
MSKLFAIKCAMALALIGGADAGQAQPLEVLQFMAKKGECGVLGVPRAQSAAATALKELMTSFPPKTASTDELTRSFLRLVSSVGTRNGVHIAPAVAVLSPRQLYNCFPEAYGYIRDGGKDVTAKYGALTRIYDVYCSMHPGACRPPQTPPESCSWSGQPFDCEEKRRSMP